MNLIAVDFLVSWHPQKQVTDSSLQPTPQIGVAVFIDQICIESPIALSVPTAV
jgi:hypothetical protein